MASPTISEVHTLLKDAVDLLEETRKYAETNSKNFAGDTGSGGMEDTLVQALEGDFSVEVLSAVAGMRTGVNAALAGAATVLEAVLRTYGKLINAPETNIQALITRIYDYFADNSITVKSSAWSYGSPSAGGSNVGNGTIRRLTTDKRGYFIENIFPGTTNAKVIQDQSTGRARHEERFELRGGVPGRDLLNMQGNGIVAGVNCFSARDSFLLNPSFSRYSGSAAVPTEITSWTPNTNIANFAIDESNYYRDFPGDTLNSGAAGSASLKISAADKLSQALSLRGTPLDPETPMHLEIAYNRQIGSGSATLKIELGSLSTTVVLAAQTGWNKLYMPIGQNCWHRMWNQDAPSVKVGLSAYTSGYVLVDDFLLVPWLYLDGDWVMPIGGSTPFMNEDTFSWADSATEGKIQKWMKRGFKRYLPSAGSPSISDP